MIASIKLGKFFTEIPNVTLFAEQVSDDGKFFNNVFLHVVDKTGTEQRSIFAQSGSLIQIAEPGQILSLRLHLNNGNSIRLDEKGTQVEKVLFKEYDFPVFNSRNAMTILPYDTMKTNSELVKIIAEKKINYQNAISAKKDLNEISELKKTLFRTKATLYSRFVILPQILLFVFLGFSLSIKGHRGGSGNNSSRALGIIISYYILYFYLLSLAHRAALDPLIAIFSPSIIFLFIALIFYKKLDYIG
jgi:lipopolysaccharide export LptBFGC system permease protein LptF